MIIKPMRDKNSKKVLSNVEICRRMYATLSSMKEKSEPSEYYGIFGGSPSTEQEVMSFLKQINDEKDNKIAQQMMQNYILPTIMKGVK
nr:MAG TPA: hypothetical protein [Caudoviricetes sp.]